MFKKKYVYTKINKKIIDGIIIIYRNARTHKQHELTHVRTYTRTHSHTHVLTHARTHAHAHIIEERNNIFMYVFQKHITDV